MSPPQTASAARRFIVVVNPIAGRRRRGFLADTLSRLRAAGLDIAVRETGARGDAERFAREAVAGARPDAVVAAGGDGTINEVVNGLAGSGLPLGIIPMGTANVLASELGIQPRAAAVSDALIRGTPRRVHLGEIDGRRFLMMAGIGYDGRVTARVDARIKYRWGKAAYGLAGLLEWLERPRETFHAVVDGVAHEAAWLVVANGRRYAGRYVVAPHAGLEKPSLSVCVMPGRGRGDLARYLLAIARGRLDREPDVTMIEAREIVIPDAPCAQVEIDGDHHGAGPFRIALARDTLDVIGPPTG
jgi:diacylglycerol kinase (ATP)